jgi:predicted RNase H-like nuclease (RuvC/YqgF family)
MLHNKHIETCRRAAADRHEAALDRLRAAVENMQHENQALQSEVSEFKGALVELRDGVEQLADSTDDYRYALTDIKTRPLRRAARRLEEIADGWLSQAEKSAA